MIIWTERLPPAFRWDPTNPVRGTEQFYVETARSATKLGEKVLVLADLDVIFMVDGVVYAPRQTAFGSEWDRMLVCNWRGEALPSAKKTVHWTNFADFTPSKACPTADRVVLISDYARKRAGYLPGSTEVAVIGHGVDKRIYHPPTDNVPRKRQCVYSSAPDRGGDWLRERWPAIEEATGYRLVMTAYPGRGQPPMERAAVAKLLQESEYWVHPGLGIELFCLSAAEAQACGCLPIYAAEGALPETCHYGHAFPVADYLDGLLTVLNAPWKRDRPSANGDHLPTWETATEAILACFSGN